MKHSKNSTVYFIILFLIISFSIKVAAQNSNGNSLLWRISGKNLKTSSYLFGTIHIKDKRVFNLNDSVIYSLQNSEVFVAEINFDSVANYALKNENSFDRKSVTLKDVLSDEEILLLNEKAKKRVGKSLKEFNYYDARMILYEFENDEFAKDMPYALDAYLYKIARANNNSISRLENIEDQIKLFAEMDNETISKSLKAIIFDTTDVKNVYELLVNAYLESDLKKLESIFSNWSNEYQSFSDKLLIKRNYQMADSIDKMILDKSCFFAVGSGHLIGNEGLIELLKKKGLIVEPVFCDNYSLVNNYTPEKLESSWITYRPKGGGFEVKMPMEPVPVPNMGMIPSVETEAVMHADVLKNLVVLAAKFVYPTKLDTSKSDSLFQSILTGVENNGYTITHQGDIITVNGVKTKSVEAKISNLIINMKMYLRDKHLYILQSINVESDNSSDNEINRFFKSFKITDYEEVIESKKWEYFAEDSCGFRIKFPGRPLVQKLIEDKYNKSIVYTAVEDSVEKIYMLLFVQNNSPFYYYSEKQMLEQIIDSYTQRSDAEIIRDSAVITDEQTYINFKFRESENTYKGKIVFRGNNIYYFLTSYNLLKGDSLAGVDYLNSFELLPYKKMNWKNYSDSLNNYSVKLPAEEYSKIDTTYDKTINSVIYDFVNGLTFKLTKKDFPDYYEADSTFFKNEITYYDYGDLIIDFDTSITRDQLLINEVVYRNKNDYNFNRVKQVLNGMTYYEISVKGPLSIMYDSSIVGTFFSSFNVNTPDSQSIFTDKTKLFFNDLVSNDTNKVNAALHYDEKFNFKNEHASVIYEILNLDSLYYKADSVRALLLNGLREIDDSTKEIFAQDYYKKFKGKPIVQFAALSVLSSIKSKSSVKTITKLLLEDTPRYKSVPYNVFSDYYDTTNSYKYYFPEILELLQFDEYQRQIYSLSRNAINNKFSDPEIFAPYADLIIKHAEHYFYKRRVAVFSDSSWFYDDISSCIMTVLTQLKPDEAIINLLKETYKDEDQTIKLLSAACLLKLNYKLPEDTVSAYLTNLETRSEFYTNLENFGLTDIADEELITQEKIAEGSMYSFLRDENDVPNAIELLDTKETEDGRYFLYKFEYVNNKKSNWYVGISGPQPLEDDFVSSYGFNTTSNFTLLNKKTIEEHWKELLNE